MGRILKWVGIALAVLMAAVLSLPLLIDVEQFKPQLESRLSTALNREVKLGHLKLSLLAGEVSADDLSVAEDEAFGKPAFVRAKSLAVGAEIWPFLTARKLVVTYLTIDQPEIALTQAPSGNWNFSSLGSKPQNSAAGSAPGGAPLDLSVERVKITNGRLRFGRTVGHWKPLVLDHVNLELQNFSATTAFPLTLSANVAGGGTIQLNGTAGPINPTDSAMTPVNATLKINALDIAGSGMTDFAPGIGGVISFDGTGSSDGRTMQTTGRVKAGKLKLAKNGTPASRALELDFAAEHDLRSHKGGIRRGDIHLGSAVAHLTGSYGEQGESMVLNMTLSGPSMPVPELEAMLPALGVVLPSGSRLDGGTVTVMLSIEGPTDKLVTSGSVALNNTRLAGFDLGKKMSAVEKLAGIEGGPNAEIQTLSADVRVAPEGASAQNIKLIMPAIGNLNGAGTVSPANDLDFKMSATVHATGLLAAAGNTAIPFTVAGTCADPVFRPDLKAAAREELHNVVKKDAGGLLKGLLGGQKK